MHFTEDPHLGWMAFWVVSLAVAAVVTLVYVRRRGRSRDQLAQARKDGST